ncbi:aminoglycoside phosphotransferase family protein [Actinomadura kijaniata]|uniref:aminoglycoside phosphotransferase family protein n=1 Tax=Actinomadura kijaniata TaxID=46161 RepID=UPI003F1D2AD3
MAAMHPDEVPTDARLVERLVRAQFPRWAGLPVTPVASGGTVNAVYRLGDALSVRLPLTADGVGDLERERRWPPRLAPFLPVPIPSVVAHGRPGEGYPWPWSVHRWIEGETPVEGALDDAGGLARDLGRFVRELRGADVADGPPAYRGGPLAGVDAATRRAIGELARTGEPFDAAAALAAWEESLAAPPWAGEPCWVHSDLMPGNLLVGQGRLTAVLDFATAGVGDPACDLIPAWNLLPATARDAFRDSAGADDATWLRGRGWALSMAVIQLPYYRRTNPVISANARYVIRAVLGPAAER